MFAILKLFSKIIIKVFNLEPETFLFTYKPLESNKTKTNPLFTENCKKT